MKRIPEPELMDDPGQALAYHSADFSESHGQRVDLFRQSFPAFDLSGAVLDIGCGSGDVLFRFARAFPRAQFTGIDGSQPMLDLAAAELQADANLRGRVDLQHVVLPSDSLPRKPWALVMSHSLLHHLHRPLVLWEAIRQVAPEGCAVFVADLCRPPTQADARRIVATRSASEPEILRRDFYNSLCAAFEPQEVSAQLAAAGLAQLSVRREGELHLVISGWHHAKVGARLTSAEPSDDVDE